MNSNFNSKEYCEKLSQAMLANWAKCEQCRTMGCTNQSTVDGGDTRYCSDYTGSFTKRTQNDWGQSRLLLKPHQCAKFWTQYESVNKSCYATAYGEL